MADKKGNASKQSENQRQSEDEERNSEENDLQLRETSQQVVQSQDGASRSSRDPNTQVVTAMASKYNIEVEGTAQIGTGNTIINKNEYYGPHHHHHHHHHLPPPPNITNLEQYYRWVEQLEEIRHSPTRQGLPPCPVSQRLPHHQLQDHREDTTDRSVQSETHRKAVEVSGHCKFCHEYHQKNHPLVSELSRRETDNTRRKTGTSAPRAQNNKPRSEQGTVGQQSLLSSRPSPSDVTSTAPGAEKVGKTANSAEAKPCERLPQTTPEARSQDQSSPVYSLGIPDSVCLIDSKGQSLEPGDAVKFKRDDCIYVGIYVGHQQVVYSDWRNDSMVVKEELKLAEPFKKTRVFNGRQVPVFPPTERIRRAESRVGRRFTEVDRRDGLYELDFPVFIFTGMGGFQARDRGFELWPY